MKCPKCGSTDIKHVKMSKDEFRLGQCNCSGCGYKDYWAVFAYAKEKVKTSFPWLHVS